MKWRTVIEPTLKGCYEEDDRCMWHGLEKSLAVISIQEILLTDGLSHRSTPFQSKRWPSMSNVSWFDSLLSERIVFGYHFRVKHGFTVVSLTKECCIHENSSGFWMETGKIKMWTKWKGSFSTIIQSHQTPDRMRTLIWLLGFLQLKQSGMKIK